MSLDFSTLSPSQAVEPVRAPAWPAAAAGLCALASLALVVPGSGSLPLAVVGYVLGALVVPAFTVIYRFGRRSAAQSPFFLPKLAVDRAVLLILVLGIVGGMANAWFIATELAKQ